MLGGPLMYRCLLRGILGLTAAARCGVGGRVILAPVVFAATGDATVLVLAPGAEMAGGFIELEAHFFAGGAHRSASAVGSLLL